MNVRNRGGSWLPGVSASMIATGLLAVAACLCMVTYQAKFVPDPDVGPIDCEAPACGPCEAIRQWRRDNPGRRPEALAEAAERGINVPLIYLDSPGPEEDPARVPPTGPPGASRSRRTSSASGCRRRTSGRLHVVLGAD